ncbi:MAG TPA: serine hydrolase domain-containing protein [Gammaproteobacteria bacterium]
MQHENPFGAAGRAASLPSARGRLQSFLEHFVRETGVPGVALAASVGGARIEASAGTCRAGEAAPLTPQHRFHLGCTAKLLAAAVTLARVDRGEVDLDAPIGEYLPELRGTPHGRAVRVSHLLSHTSGYRGADLFAPQARALTWDGLVAYLRAAPRFFAPGTVFSYEHTESVLLGRILERVAGRPCLAVIRRELMGPLGIEPGRIEDAGNDPHDAGRHAFDAAANGYAPLGPMTAMSELWHPAFSNYTLSPADLATVGEALLGVRSAAGVSAAVRPRLLRPVVRLPPALGGPLRELLPIAFGLGAAAWRGGQHGHNGLTHGQCIGLRLHVEPPVVVAVGVNAVAPHLRDFALGAASAALTGEAASAAEPPPVELELERLQGVYLGPGRAWASAAFGDGRLRVSIRSGAAGPAVTAELADAGEGRGLVLRSPMPQLSLGFFGAPESEEAGLMVGLHAFKRVAPNPRAAAERSVRSK